MLKKETKKLSYHSIKRKYFLVPYVFLGNCDNIPNNVSYRNVYTLDFSNEALQASEKGYARLITAIKTLENLKTSSASTSDIKKLEQDCYAAMNDDFNSPVLIANLFEGARIINSVNDGKETITADDLTLLKKIMNDFTFSVLGLKPENLNAANDKALQGVMNIILDIRKDVKTKKDFALLFLQKKIVRFCLISDCCMSNILTFYR